MKSFKRILIVFGVIFILHLIPIAYIFYVTGAAPEAVMAWLLFLLLDFPLGWLYFFVEPIVLHPYNDFWNWRLAPALFFQFIGSINWLLIYLLAYSLFKAIKRFFVLWFMPME